MILQNMCFISTNKQYVNNRHANKKLFNSVNWYSNCTAIMYSITVKMYST